MSTETSCHFGHLLQVPKKSIWSLILYNFFMILYMYIAPGQGLTTLWGQNFDVNRNILSFRSFVARLKKISLKSDFRSSAFWSWDEDFLRFLPYMGMAAILVMWPGPFEQTFVPPSPRHFYEIWLWLAQWFLRRCLKSVDDVRRHTTEAYLSYKLTK